MNLQDPSSKRKKCLKVLGFSAVGLAGVLAVWIVGGNYIASVQEKEIDRDLAAFAQRFPKTEPNDSALKLAALMAKLGMTGFSGDLSPIFFYMESSADFRPSEVDRKAFEEIQEELKQYLDAQITKPNDSIDPPSEKLQRYLASKQTVLAEIRQHVLTNEVPHWGTDITYIVEGDPTVALPGYLWQVEFHRILALDILEKYRQGQMENAAEMLEVSWKVNQPLTESPDLIGQLVALIVTKYPAGVMRKVDNIPVELQQRLLERDYRESVLTSLQGEALHELKFWQNFIWNHSENSITKILGVDNTIEIFKPIIFEKVSMYMPMGENLPLQAKIAGLTLDKVTLERILDWTLSKAIFGLKPVMKPYVRFSAIDTYRVKQRSFAASRQQNVCVSDSVMVDGFAWWNYIGWVWSENLTSQSGKAATSMLELELTQKILQVKALAAKEGKWLPSIPDMESSICPGAKWIYRLAPDGTMSISFSEKPQWLEKRLKNGGLPFTYSDKTPPKPNKPAKTPQKR
jgi:hypothetical protein